MYSSLKYSSVRAGRIYCSRIVQLQQPQKRINFCSAGATMTGARALGRRFAGRAKRSRRPRCSGPVRHRRSWADTSVAHRPCGSGGPCPPGTRALRARRTCPTRTSSPWSARSTWRRLAPRIASCNRPRTPWPPCNRTAVAPLWPRPSRCC